MTHQPIQKHERLLHSDAKLNGLIGLWGLKNIWNE